MNMHTIILMATNIIRTGMNERQIARQELPLRHRTFRLAHGANPCGLPMGDRTIHPAFTTLPISARRDSYDESGDRSGDLINDSFRAKCRYAVCDDIGSFQGQPVAVVREVLDLCAAEALGIGWRDIGIFIAP
jgi:hypothetical protein